MCVVYSYYGERENASYHIIAHYMSISKYFFFSELSVIFLHRGQCNSKFNQQTENPRLLISRLCSGCELFSIELISLDSLSVAPPVQSVVQVPVVCLYLYTSTSSPWMDVMFRLDLVLLYCFSFGSVITTVYL